MDSPTRTTGAAGTVEPTPERFRTDSQGSAHFALGVSTIGAPASPATARRHATSAPASQPLRNPVTLVADRSAAPMGSMPGPGAALLGPVEPDANVPSTVEPARPLGHEGGQLPRGQSPVLSSLGGQAPSAPPPVVAPVRSTSPLPAIHHPPAETSLGLPPVETRGSKLASPRDFANVTFFSRLTPPFADALRADQAVLTASFLASCAALLPFIDALGPTAFAPVRADIKGTIDKIAGHEQRHGVAGETLQGLITGELNAYVGVSYT